MNPATVDIASLPWLPLEFKADFPRQPSIYFAIDPQNHVQYIGKADNTKERWKSHNQYQKLNAIGGVKIAFLFLNELESLLETEAELITWFDPLINKLESLLETEAELITWFDPLINKSPNLKGRKSKSLLQSERKKIITRIAALVLEGDILTGVRLDKASSGGTASPRSQTSYKYARLRSGRGKMLSNGQKSQYIPLQQIAVTEAAISRGKEYARLQKRLENLSKMLG